jgi:hypothetical protein
MMRQTSGTIKSYNSLWVLLRTREWQSLGTVSRSTKVHCREFSPMVLSKVDK